MKLENIYIYTMCLALKHTHTGENPKKYRLKHSLEQDDFSPFHVGLWC